LSTGQYPALLGSLIVVVFLIVKFLLLFKITKASHSYEYEAKCTAAEPPGNEGN
jgi:hypothetical protein